ncbi:MULTISPECIES: DUF6932 family protein [unclassified Inquilinus]|uniref:DUF6932 family protein n=1 Tax=unclassified Inquilinus TaxID=2645927 RepID=UPI003F929CD3
MPIPPFTIDGVLPPYVGPDGPGGAAEDMSPYVATALEVALTFALTGSRKSILRGWLRHRDALRAIGFNRGFQWLDGSFVENKDPRDLDVVSFLYRPEGISTPAQLEMIMHANLNLFSRPLVKAEFSLDAFLIDLDGSPEALVNSTRYFLGLFSHRRGDDLWKGMLQVRLDDVADDHAALTALGPEPVTAASTQGANP